MEYPKLNSLWKREGWYFEQGQKNGCEYKAGRQSFIIGDYAQPEFPNIKLWKVDEKVDGTNIRICFYRKSDQNLIPSIHGRTDAAQLPCNLLSYLTSTFTWEAFAKAFPDLLKESEFLVWIFGEGYGPKIQSAGSNYRGDPGFIMFDVRVGNWWLKKEDIKEIAQKFSVPVVPDLGIMTEEQVIEFVKSKPLSLCSRNPQMMEGVVCRSEPLMLTRSGKPVMWKLKCKEFE